MIYQNKTENLLMVFIDIPVDFDDGSIHAHSDYDLLK